MIKKIFRNYRLVEFAVIVINGWLLNMLKLIYYSSFILILFLIGILFSSIEQQKVYPNHAHITIYIERSFTDFEHEKILKAAIEWTETTNHIIEYDVVRLPTKDPINFNNSVFITKISPDHPNVLSLDNKRSDGDTLGFFDTKSYPPHIALVTNRIIEYEYEIVVLHELGHSLGLKHLEGIDGVDTLMFPSIDLASEHIRLEDGLQFCKLYHCDGTKLKYKEKSFHF